MSITRLAGLLARAAAPAGRLAADRVAGVEAAGADRPALGMPALGMPAFDAPASVGTSMLRATLAETPALPPLRRADSSPPFVSPRPASGALPAASPPSPVAMPAHARAVLAPPTPPVVVPLPQPDPMPSSPAAAAPAVAPAPGPAPGPPVLVIATPSPHAAAHGVESVAGKADPAASVVSERPRPGPPAMMVSPLHSDFSTAASVTPAPTFPPHAAPTISIGTVEVVIAQAPQRPAAPARLAPDRGFARYAAMRGARDRAW
jgi:hypothetical protein